MVPRLLGATASQAHKVPPTRLFCAVPLAEVFPSCPALPETEKPTVRATSPGQGTGERRGLFYIGSAGRGNFTLL